MVDAAQILVMADGRIVERGTHPELLALDGRYAHMWRLQQTHGDTAAASAGRDLATRRRCGRLPQFAPALRDVQVS